jgi:RNA polymerase sigma factor (sigma-70 family)
LTFSELYDQYHKLVYNLALHYVQQIEDAEEITQDVFLSVHKSLSTFQYKADLKTWIYRIAINKSLDYIKAKNRKKRLGFLRFIWSDHETEYVPSLNQMNHPGIDLEQKESVARIFRAINELPENQKTALILNKIEQMTLPELAEIMNLSYKATESLIQRAKQNLSKKI